MRCLLVWLSTTTVTAVVLVGLCAELTTVGGLTDPSVRATVRFDALLIAGAALALACCALWFWLVTSIVVVRAAAGRLRPVRGCPDGVRRLVLAGCGLALAAGATVSPAIADSTAGRPPGATDGQVVSGLPLPDRATAPPPTSHPTVQTVEVARVRDVHRVRHGDSLWAIAQRSLPGAATDVDIDQRWREIWAANREAIGADPDLIHPGTTLHLPSAPKES